MGLKLCLWYTIAISPVRQRALKGLFQGYLFNGYRRLASQFGYWAIPFAIGMSPLPFILSYISFSSELTTAICPVRVFAHVLGYGTYAWAKKYDAWQNSKAAHEHGVEH